MIAISNYNIVNIDETIVLDNVDDVPSCFSANSDRSESVYVNVKELVIFTKTQNIHSKHNKSRTIIQFIFNEH